jgi:hypothetical protein
MTVAPSAAARSAVARPIPDVPPKITIRSDSNCVFNMKSSLLLLTVRAFMLGGQASSVQDFVRRS